MGLDIEKIKDVAEDAIDKVASNKDAKKAVYGVIDTVEKKVKVDLPDVDAIKKSL